MATHITDPRLRGTIKELSQLDGAFVVGDDGVVVAACRYLGVSAEGIEVPLGLGSRHLAGAAVSKQLGVIAIVVSESGSYASSVMVSYRLKSDTPDSGHAISPTDAVRRLNRYTICRTLGGRYESLETPVWIVGHYDFEAPPPWHASEWLASHVDLSARDLASRFSTQLRSKTCPALALSDLRLVILSAYASPLVGGAKPRRCSSVLPRYSAVSATDHNGCHVVRLSPPGGSKRGSGRSTHSGGRYQRLSSRERREN
jgi:DisA checkpoint controller-like protein